MKTIRKVAYLGLFLSLFFSNQIFAQRSLDAFDQVRATGNIEVFVQQGESESIRIEAQGIDKEDVSVKVKSGTLRLKLVKSLFYKNVKVKAYVTYRQLRGLRASAGATIEANGVIEGDKVELRAGSGSWILADLKTNTVEATATEGGILKLRGTSATQKTSVATGGQCDCEKLETQRAYVKANTGGQAKVFVSEFLEASANTGGGVKYAGNPRSIETKELMSGGVEKM